MESESFIMTVTIYLIFLQLNVFTQTDNMAKRKGQAMLDRVSKMARALGEEKGDVFVPMEASVILCKLAFFSTWKCHHVPPQYHVAAISYQMKQLFLLAHSPSLAVQLALACSGCAAHVTVINDDYCVHSLQYIPVNLK